MREGENVYKFLLKIFFNGQFDIFHLSRDLVRLHSLLPVQKGACTHLTLHFPQLLFPPQGDSIPTPNSLEASSTVSPSGNSPLLPEGKKITWNFFISNDSF